MNIFAKFNKDKAKPINLLLLYNDHINNININK